MSAQSLPVPGLLEASAPPERRGLARDGVRLLVTDRSERTHKHARFTDLASFLRAGDVAIVNNSGTLPAAITALRANGESLDLHVATQIDARIWMAEPRATVVCGEELRLPRGGSAVTIAPVDPEHPRLWYTWFDLPSPMHAFLSRVGKPIRYGYVQESFPLDDYQTMFAREPGSSEMPSAARPFTPRVVTSLGEQGVEIAAITLHCGVASFEQPERPASERYSVSPATADIVNAARREGRRVIAIGTTVVRALESAWHEGEVTSSSGWADLVIEGDHVLRTVDALVTGFHTQTATHQGMLRAFADPALLDEAYECAAEAEYACHEFGDSHLIL